MYFNRILNMPITNTTRCRIYNSPTSFMAKTYFDENGELKNSICVDVIECYISNNIKVVLNLLYNEEKELFTLKHIGQYSGQSCFYYLMFNICDLQEVLNMISAKSILHNKIFEVKECEYVDCEREDGYFVIDSYRSYFEEDISNKLGSFTETKDYELFFEDKNSKIDIKDVIVKQSTYFFKVGKIIIHKSLSISINICNLLNCTDNIENYNASIKTISPINVMLEYDNQPFEYALNSNVNQICALYNTKDVICYFSSILNNGFVDNVNELTPIHTQSIVQLDKERFTERALSKVMNEAIENYKNLKSIFNCKFTLSEAIEKIRNNNIFMLFDM